MKRVIPGLCFLCAETMPYREESVSEERHISHGRIAPFSQWLACGVGSVAPCLEVGFREAVTVGPGVEVLLVQRCEVVVRHSGL